MTGCTYATSYGECIGIFDDGDPGLVYKPDGFNIAIAVVFFEMVVPPIVVVLDDARCPVAVKKEVQR